MRRCGLLLAALLILSACASNAPAATQASFGQPPESLAFVDDPAMIAQALIGDTLVADAAGARCAGDRIAGQLSIESINHVRSSGSIGGLMLAASEAEKLVDALFDCTDPRDGVIVGMHADGLDPLVAECIGKSLDLDVYAAAMTHSFSDGSAAGLQPFAEDLRRATSRC